MLKLDWSGSRALHNCHGHHVFVRELRKSGKTRQWLASICQSLQCKEADDVLKNGI